MVQMSMDYSGLFPENLSQSERSEIRDYYSNKNIALCFHGPSDIPLMNRHDSVRNAAVDRLSELIDLAVELGGEHFIFHPGRLAFYSAGKGKLVFIEKRIPSKRLGYIKDSLNEILDRAAGRISICIENTHYMPASLIEIIGELLENRDMGLAWDIGYADILPDDKRARMLKFINDNIKHVRIAHLHDITEKGGHKALGTGSVNIPAYLDIINEISADIILEIFPENSLLKSVEYLNNLAEQSNIAP